MTSRPDLMHSPGPANAEGITYCLLCGYRIFQNTSRIERSRNPADWAHVSPAGSEMGFLFTCPGPPESKSLATHIYGTVRDLVSSLLYYDRKEDEDLPVGAIEAALQAGLVTVDAIVEAFRRDLIEGLEE